ncbi:ATP-binding protein [Thermoflexibacter ruber]|uniref:histidine kinase n=1 Tax=Thermoflexibacter ruber TaxID=1003 RepID=A0A1I2B440_9BACT|nr:ATP-binding protein [Thermoflexibacter ruber]SFE50846.1 Tetratricopeptide repeat-containing protein [Thermoflexibacter ruber]
MCKVLKCIFLYLLAAIYLPFKFAWGQKSYVDSLEIALHNAQNDTNKVLIISKLLEIYLISGDEKGEQISEQGILLSRKLGFNRGEMLLSRQLGEFYQRQGKYAQSVFYTNNSLQIAENLQDLVSIADAYFTLAIIYTDGLKQYNLAIFYALEALQIYEKQNHQDGKANTYNLIAWVYGMTNQHLDLAHIYIDKAIRIAQRTKEKKFLAYYWGTKGLIYKTENQLDSAIFYFQKANQDLEKINDKAIIAYFNIFLGEIYLQQAKDKEALRIYQQAVQYGTEAEAQDFLKDAYLGLSKIYASQNQYDKAYDYQKLHLQIKDSIFNWTTSQRLAVIQQEYENEKQKVQIALLEKEKQLIQEEKRTYIISFLGGLFTAIIVLFLVVHNSRQKAKANMLLQAKNKEIEAQNEELRQSKEEIEAQNEELHQSREEIQMQRDLVAQQNLQLIEAQNTIISQSEQIKQRNIYLEKIVEERTQELKFTVQDLLKHIQDLEQFSFIISHNLRAPVARIQGLINIFNQEKIEDNFNKQVLTHIFQSAQSLDTVISDLTEIISIRKSLNTNKEFVNINELVENELASLDNALKQADAFVEKKLNVSAFYSVKAYLQSIIHHLLSNAIKYKYPHRPLRILITTSMKENYFCLSVQDNGLGVDTSDPYKIFGLYQRMHTHVEGKGFGLFLVKTQIEAMRGRIEVESIINQGSTFKVFLPV